ncbi:MAG: N-acetyltransferase [Chloroflexota bacterium]
MDILPATIRDLNSLRHLEKTCFPKDAWPLLDLLAVLTWPEVIRLKAVIHGEMVGFIAADTRRSKDLTWIATIGILPEYRRRGIARALLEACEAQIFSDRIRLCVRDYNNPAIEMYRSAGYLPTDTWRRYYNDGGDALVMEKKRNGET